MNDLRDHRTETAPPDQAARDAALDPRRSVIVQAPAGSGKTGLLVQRFLGLLAEVSQPEEIVAITFTRKAAAEMRERILSAMHAARETSELPTSMNAQRTHALASKALEANARHGWSLLENPARLRVTTIDAFNTMLARQLPVRSGFGQSPAIAEQAGELYRTAARRLLAGMDRNDDAGEALRILLGHLDNRPGDLAELLSGMLAKRDLWQRHLEFGGLDREALEAALASEVENVLRVLHAEFPAHLHLAVPDIAKRCAAYLERRGDDVHWLQEIAAWTESPGVAAEDLPRWQLLARLLLTGTGGLRKPKGLNATAGFPAASEKGIDVAEKAMRESHKAAMCDVLAAAGERPTVAFLLARVLQLPHARYTESQWRVLEALNTLLPYAVLALQECFRDGGEVDFPELAIRARAALGTDDQRTDLALRLDHQVRHLLVDEFQDTSHSQIDLLLRLTREWQPDDGRTLFLVGDPMQSIYQFREAEVGHFLVVRDHGLGELDLQSLRLTANFRSQHDIVEWVNSAFSTIFPASDDIATGAVMFERSDPVLPALDETAVQVHAFDQYAFDAEAARVLELIRAGESDPGNTTAILVRGRSHLASILPMLRENNVAFRAVELDSLETLPLVQDLLALTRAIVNPVDSTAFFSVLRAPWCGLTLADMQALADTDKVPFQLLQDEAGLARLSNDGVVRLSRIKNVFAEAENARGRRPLHERLAVAWHALGGPAVLREPEDLDNAQLYFELLQQMESAADLADVNDLEARLKQLYAAPDPQAGNAVQIMTLHKAKGLQFDTVIIPALDQVTGRKDRLLFHWIERPQVDGSEHVLLGPVKSREDEEGGAIYRFIERLKDEKEALERARLLYVGITRAKRHVHLLGKARWSSSGGAMTLASPRSGSLLELLWPLPDVRAAFDALPIPTEKPQRPERTGGETALSRLPAGWTPKPLDNGLAIDVVPNAIASADDSTRIVYEWAGDRVRHVGTLVHRALERMAEDGLQAWSMERVRGLPLEQQLLALGLPEGECGPAAAEVRVVLERILESRHAAWLLAPHEQARNEWALGGVDRGDRVSVSLDRSFVDAEGIRWIIDYKTSTHEGGDMEGFLAQQQLRYRRQLERYARLVHALEGRPVKVALYFPLQDALKTWTPELD